MDGLKDYNMPDDTLLISPKKEYISLDIDSRYTNIKCIIKAIEEYKNKINDINIDKNLLFEYVMLAAKSSLSPKFVKEFIDTQL